MNSIRTQPHYPEDCACGLPNAPVVAHPKHKTCPIRIRLDLCILITPVRISLAVNKVTSSCWIDTFSFQKRGTLALNSHSFFNLVNLVNTRRRNEANPNPSPNQTTLLDCV